MALDDASTMLRSSWKSGDTREVRFAAARRHLAETKGWHVGTHDLCPACGGYNRRRTLEPTPELLAVAQRVATREWTVAPDEDAFTGMDPNLRTLVDVGYVELHLPPTRLRDDYWTLTEAGRAWLDEYGRD